MAGTSVSSSQNTASSQSQSTTGVLDYPERSFLDAIAQYAGTVGQNVYNWAQGEYAKNSSLTDANVHNYLNTSASALGQAGSLQDTYRNTALPEAKQIISEGNNYASPSRMMLDMGAAESGQQQAGNTARQNAERDLQSFGIDPSSGRYAALDRAAQVSSAAAAVGAAQQARQFDITTGQNLQQAGLGALDSTTGAFQGATTNAENTALQGFAGSENAGLANANTGVALQGAASPFLNTAASYKPVVGTNSTSSSNSQGTSGSVSNTTDPAQQQKQPTSGSGGGSASDPMYQAGQGSAGSGSGAQVTTVPSSGDGTSTGSSPFDTGTSGFNDFGLGTDTTGTFGSGTGGSDMGTSATDFMNSGGSNFTDTSGFGDPSGITITPLGDMSSGSGASADPGSGDTSFAAGGAIDEDTGAIPDDGGQIPASASPSGGLQTDDVQAQGPHGQINVNADEFVIPRDVALWKGQEFFQKLIAQSRQARVMAPARPSRGPPQAQGMR